MEAAERRNRKDEREGPMFVDTSMLETDIQILESEIMTPSPMATPLHQAFNTNFLTPAGQIIAEEDNATISSIRTPADNLLDRFQSLNESWVDVKTRSASAKKRVMATPTIEDLLNSPIPKFSSALDDYISNGVQEDDENDDLSSIGASTVSSMSSQESVFDRLYKQGTIQQRRRRNQKPSDSFSSPRENISTNEFHTPYSSTSSVSSSRSRVSKNSTSKQQTKKIRNRVVPTSAATSSVAKNKSKNESMASSVSSQDTVFERLYRNQKRTETLWQAPPTPLMISDRKRSGRKSGSRRATKIPAPSTPQTASKPQQKKTRISASPAGAPKKEASSDIGRMETSKEAAYSTRDSADLFATAPQTAEESTGDDSVRSSAALALDEASTTSEKENKSRARTVPAPREHSTALKNSNWSTTSIDEDLAELAAIQRDLEQQQQHLAPTPRKTNVPTEKVLDKVSAIEPKQLYASSDDQAGDASHSTLDDFDAIWKAPQVSISRAPSVASTATHTQVDDDDTTSRASSGFFTLDNARSSLTLQPLVSFPRGSMGSKQPSVPKTVRSERIRKEQAAVSIQSWWKSCLAQVSLANMVIEQRNLTFPSAHDTSPMILLRIINSTRPHDLTTKQHGDVLVAQSSQISLEVRLAVPTFLVLRQRLSNATLIRAVLASARLEFEGIAFVEACQGIQRWWRRTRETAIRKHVPHHVSTLNVSTGARRDKEPSFCLEDANDALADDNLLETLSNDSAEHGTLHRTSFEPQKTPTYNESSLLDDFGDSDEEPLVSPAKALAPSHREIDGGRKLFHTPPTSFDSAIDDGYIEQGESQFDDPTLFDSPASPLIESYHEPKPVETPSRIPVEGEYIPIPVETPPRTLAEEGVQVGEREVRHEAASVIQRSFRMLTLTSAIEHSTPARDHVRQALSSPKFPRWQEDDPWLFKEPSDGFQLWIGSTDLIERNAARLATHNIVRAYLNGLRKYRRSKKAALIQSVFRAYQCKREYQKKRWAVVSLQHRWKASKHCRMLNSKATMIKAAYKMKLAKTRFQMMRFASILIQNRWRSYHATREFSKVQFLASWLQRTCVRARGQRRQYLALRSATISLQYSFRVYSTKKKYNLEVFKATKIQCAWRMSLAARQRLLSIYYASKIQALARSHFASRDYLRLKSSSIIVQSCWRKYKAMKMFEMQLSNTVKMQALWRRCLAVRWYWHQYQSVVRLQALGRMQQCVRLKRESLKAAVVIQRETRRFLAESSYLVIWKAALTIQTQQRRYSAQSSWLKTRSSVICIQSAVRRYSCQQSFKKYRDALVKIQSLGRCYNQKRQFVADRNDITIVQSLLRRKLAQNYLSSSRAAAIRCQKMVRCHFSSSAFRRAKVASIEIQKIYRRYRATQNWKTTVKSTIRIQSFLRMVHARDSANHTLFCVQILQSVVRGYQQRSRFTSQKQAAVKIQSIARNSRDKAKYSEKRKASISIQSIARRQAARYRLNQAKAATVTIQTAARKMLCRSSYVRIQVSVRKIQATARGLHQRLLYNKTRNDVMDIQRFWRGAIARFQASSHYRAALVIQRYWRGKVCRDLSKRRKSGIVSIQRFSRGHISRRQHKRLLHSRLVLAQSSWRAAVWRRKFVARKSSASKLQAVVRGYLARKEAASKLNSAVVIQGLVRRHQQQLVYSTIRVAAVMIQAWARGRLVRRSMEIFSSMATRVQRRWRGHLGRLRYEEFVEKRNCEIATARLIIQSMWRMHKCRVQFRKAKSAATVIQTQWRAFSARENFEFSRIASIVIQTVARGVLVRMKMNSWQQCALCIQKSWRGYVGARRFQFLVEQHRLAKLETADRIRRAELMGLAIRALHGLACISVVVQNDLARQQRDREQPFCIVIQSHARGMLVRRRLSKLRSRPTADFSAPSQGVLEQSIAATKIQTIYRKWSARKSCDARLQSLIALQKLWRGRMEYKALQLRLASCVTIQRTVRGSLTRVAVNRWHKSAISIQRIWRGFASLQQTKMLRTLMVKAVIAVQSKWRMHKATAQYKNFLISTIKVQKHSRVSLARSRYQLARRACVVIQSNIRGALIRQEVKARKESIIRVQKALRQYIDAKKVKSEVVLPKQSLAASTIQSTRLMQSPQEIYHSRLRSILVIQKHWRSSQAREHFEMCRGSCVIIQSVARGCFVRDEIRLLHKSAGMIQRFWRSSLARERYELCRASCVILQSIIREYLVRKKLLEWNESATCLQKTWRKCKSSKNIEGITEVAFEMQSSPRTPESRKAPHPRAQLSIAVKTADDEDSRQHHLDGASNLPEISAIDVVHDLLNRSATPIQKLWRGASIRGSLAKSQANSTIAATLIQASFRGHRARQLYQTTLLVQSVSATLIQSNVRAMLARNNLQERTNAARAIQRFWRNRSLRLALLQLAMDVRLTRELEDSYECEGATVLQSLARRRIARKSFCSTRNKIIAIQSVVRGHLLRMRLIKSIRAAGVIQAVTRGHLLRMRLEDNIQAAVTIQKNMRGASTRSHIRGLHNAATIIQAFFRMFLVARLFWFLRLPRESRELLNNAARKIQVAFFLFKMRLAVISMQSSAIILKRCIRGQLVRSAAKFALVHVNSAFQNPVILSFARVVAGNDPDYAPTYVAWRRAVTQAEISSTIVIQSAVRRFLVRTRIFREFNVSFDSHLLLDQTLIEEEHTSAMVIQEAFKRWKSRKECNFLLENRIAERNEAAIQMQRMARGRSARILARKHRTRVAKMSRNATAIVLEAIQRSSEARVHQLLESHSSTASLSPSLKQIVDRTRAARAEAATLSSNPLPMYAVEVLKKMDYPNDESLSLKPKKFINLKPKPIRVEMRAAEAASLEPKRPSTPVRCNKTQTVKKVTERDDALRLDVNKPVPPKPQHKVNAMDLLKFGRETMKKAPLAKTSAKPTPQLAKTNVPLVKSVQVPKSAQKQVKTESKVVLGAMDLIKLGREAMKKKPDVKPTTQPLKTNVTVGSISTQSPPQSPPSNKSNNTLFGDPNNMPSPIKKQADWDWADEW